MTPLISLIVPIYNMSEHLEACVASALRQDYPRMELLLVDDGSTDDSLERCRELSRQHPEITVLHQPNSGSGPARNLGIAHASGDYALFIDADDLLAPGAVSRLAQATEDGLYDTLVFGYRTETFSGQFVAEKTYEPVTRLGEELRQDYSECVGEGSRFRIQGAPWNKLFSLRLIRQYGIEYPPLRRHQDEGFIGRYMCHAQRVRFLSDVLYTYYVSDLRTQWQRFPVDYLDSVIGLYQDRQKTILQWNPQDVKTRQRVNLEYIETALRAIELSFSPKFPFNARQRLAWIRDAAARAGLAAIEAPPSLGPSKAVELAMVRKGQFRRLYAALWARLQLEKIGLFELASRLRKL